MELFSILLGSIIGYSSQPRVKMSTRKDLTVSEKVAILERINFQPQGTSHRHLFEVLGVPSTTIGRLIRQEADLQSRLTEEPVVKGSRGQKSTKEVV